MGRHTHPKPERLYGADLVLFIVVAVGIVALCLGYWWGFMAAATHPKPCEDSYEYVRPDPDSARAIEEERLR